MTHPDCISLDCAASGTWGCEIFFLVSNQRGVAVIGSRNLRLGCAGRGSQMSSGCSVSYLAVFLRVGAREQRMEDDDGLVQIPHKNPLRKPSRDCATMKDGVHQRAAAPPPEEEVSAPSPPYLQVAIGQRRGVVLAAPAPRLGAAASARSLVQLLDGRGGSWHRVKVP